MQSFLRKNGKVIGLLTVLVLIGSLIYGANNGSNQDASVTSVDTLALQASTKEPEPGSKDPKTYVPAVIGSEKVTGFEEADPVKENFVLVTISADQVESALAASSGAQIILEGTGSTTTIAVPESDAQKIQAVSSSVTIEDNQPVGTFAEETQTPTPSWGLDRIDLQTRTLDNAYKYDSTGAGVTLYVVDTGINTTHTDFSNRLRTGFSAVNDGRGVEDCNGHGTHVAGSAAGSRYGVAKAALIVPVRVLNCQGSGYNSDIISGINWIINTHPGGPAVINLSIGGGYSVVLNSAITEAANRGFTVVAAAGNSSADACNFSPVSAAGVIGVGASTNSDSFASYSNFGSCVDIVAPGSSITSAWTGSASAANTISGTSMASPHVAGLAARILQVGTGGSGVLATMQSLAARDLITGLRSGTPNLLAVWQIGLLASPSPSPTLSKSPSPTKSTGRNATKSPGKAKNLAFTQLSETDLQVTWATPDSETSAMLVEWFVKNNPGQISNVLVPIPNSAVTITGLTPGRPYEIRVTAVNGIGTQQVKGESAAVVISLSKNFVSPSPTPTESAVAPAPTDSVVNESTTSGNSGNAPGNSGNNRGNGKR